MTDETCPERVRLVEELAEAINNQKHCEDADKVEAGARMQRALDAVRTHKATDGCHSEDKSKDKAS